MVDDVSNQRVADRGGQTAIRDADFGVAAVRRLPIPAEEIAELSDHLLILECPASSFDVAGVAAVIGIGPSSNWRGNGGNDATGV